MLTIVFVHPSKAMNAYTFPSDLALTDLKINTLRFIMMYTEHENHFITMLLITIAKVQFKSSF